MSLWQGLAGLFGRRKTIDQISSDELKRERIALEQTQRRVQREIDNLEARKHELFLKGKDAASSRERVELAQQIWDLESAIREKAKDLDLVHKNLRIVTGLLQLKERMDLIRRLKVGSLISRLSVEDLATYVDQAIIGERFEMEKFTALLEALQGATEGDLVKTIPPEVQSIVAAMEEAKAAEEAGRPDEVARAVQKMDELLAEKAPDSDQS